jgi:hypothetical protein
LQAGRKRKAGRKTYRQTDIQMYRKIEYRKIKYRKTDVQTCMYRHHAAVALFSLSSLDWPAQD